ncbi:MAG TPA: DNA replication/repair protein RecF [Actinomycetota bacterium]|jgi:DNA replication and repair protein RecF|nr:DNA replication/repair protein RecF [Actinomycetota bacterium]
MRLAWVELRDFRNHAHTQIDPVPDGLTVAVGPNGEGKTNLLEGMYFLFSLASPRVSANMPLVRESAAAAYCRGEVEAAEGRVLVEVEIPSRGASRVKVNRSPVRRKRDLRRQVRAVFFGPDDLDVVRGDPSHRRRFLDEALIALWPLKESLLTAYDRALRQRNRLLKEWEGRGAPAGLEAWDEELAAAGASVIQARADAVDRLAPHASEEFRHLAGYDLACDYAPNVAAGDDVEGRFRSRLAERRPDELARRTSLVGPHRDDLALAVRDLVARSFASHGEAWAAALCLRVGLASAVEAEIAEPPVLIVDDPFSALDPGRRDLIGERLAGRDGQVIISVADEMDVPRAAHTTWDVKGGAVAPRKA